MASVWQGFLVIDLQFGRFLQSKRYLCLSNVFLCASMASILEQDLNYIMQFSIRCQNVMQSWIQCTGSGSDPPSTCSSGKELNAAECEGLARKTSK